jgi:hypothetical protein
LINPGNKIFDELSAARRETGKPQRYVPWDTYRDTITCDLDFGDIMAVTGDVSPDIIICRLENSKPENINKRLKQVLRESSKALAEGALVIVEETRHRVRLLPV